MWVYRIRGKTDIMFMLEFCWIAVHHYMIFLTVAGLGALYLIEEKSFGVYSK